MVDYVKNSELLKELEIYENTGEITNNLGSYFLQIATGLSHKPIFKNYTYIEDMISDAVWNCCRYVGNFDINKTKNPFSYFTQIIYFSFLRYIQSEKKQIFIKYKLTEENLNEFLTGDNDINEYIYSHESNNSNTDYIDHIRDFIHKYEKSIEKKKMQAKKRKG